MGGSRLVCLSDFNIGSAVSWMTSHDILYPDQKRPGGPTQQVGKGGATIHVQHPNSRVPQYLSMMQPGAGNGALGIGNGVNAPIGGASTSGFRAFTSGGGYSSSGFHKKVSNFPLQQFGFRMLKTTQANQRKTCTILSTFDGGLGCLIPVEEKMFKRLLLLEQIMNMLLPTTLALNPRDYRLLYGNNAGVGHHRFAAPGLRTAVNSSTQTSNPKTLHYQMRKTILDGCSLFRYVQLEYAVQEEIAQMIGTHAILLRENLREIEYVSRFF